MIPVTVNGVELLIKPKRLLDYVDKLDFIKTRRKSPADLMQGIPTTIQKDRYDDLMRIAMHTVYTSSSSVSWEEELSFDKSEEGFYYDLWRCLPPVEGKKGAKESWKEGLNRARALWESATMEEKRALTSAMNMVDERSLEKN